MNLQFPVERMNSFAGARVNGFKSPVKDRDTGGGFRGVMAPSKIVGGWCSKFLFIYYFSVSEYQIVTYSTFLCISRSISTFH